MINTQGLDWLLKLRTQFSTQSIKIPRYFLIPKNRDARPPSVYFKDKDSKEKKEKKLVNDISYKGNTHEVFNY